MAVDLQSIAYHCGKYAHLSECNVNIMTHALQYGTMVFGGLRGYFNPEKNNLYIFRIKDHCRRLCNSARIMQMKPTHDAAAMEEVILEVARRNNYRENVYFRPFIYKSALQLSPRLHDVDDEFSVYSLPLNDYLDTRKGLRMTVSSWRRIDENMIPARAKVSGGYANSALAKSEALQNGFDEAILLDSQGFVSEGSAENLFLVREGELITPAVSASILEGITRKSILEIATREGIPISERTVARSELYTADELFLVGTGAQVAWITEVDHRVTGNGTMGPITKRLQEKFMQIVMARDDTNKHWLTAVYD